MTGVQNWIFIAVVYGLVGGSFWLAPAVRSTGQYFGVTVAEEFRSSKEARRIAGRFRWTVAAWVMVAVAIHLSGPAAARWVPLVALLILTIGATYAMVTARTAVLPNEVAIPAIRTASLAPEDGHIPGGLATMVGPFLALGATAVYLYSKWEQLPERFPTYYLATGHPELFEAKSLQTVFGPLAIGAVIVLLTLGGIFAVWRGTPTGPAAAGRFRQATLNAKGVGVWLLTILVIHNSLSRFLDRPLIPIWLMATVLISVALAASWPLFRMSLQPGGGGEQLPASAWKLGILYYNPDDPAILVRRRFTIGYTLNFGNKGAWAMVGLGAVLVVAARALQP